jgi:hypothetical protein
MFQPLTVSILTQLLDLKLQDAIGHSSFYAPKSPVESRTALIGGVIRRIIRFITDSGTEPGAGG